LWKKVHTKPLGQILLDNIIFVMLLQRNDFNRMANVGLSTSWSSNVNGNKPQKHSYYEEKNVCNLMVHLEPNFVLIVEINIQ
jgi:hypothetical protein